MHEILTHNFFRFIDNLNMQKALFQVLDAKQLFKILYRIAIPSYATPFAALAKHMQNMPLDAGKTALLIGCLISIKDENFDDSVRMLYAVSGIKLCLPEVNTHEWQTERKEQQVPVIQHTIELAVLTKNHALITLAFQSYTPVLQPVVDRALSQCSVETKEYVKQFIEYIAASEAIYAAPHRVKPTFTS